MSSSGFSEVFQASADRNALESAFKPFRPTPLRSSGELFPRLFPQCSNASLSGLEEGPCTMMGHFNSTPAESSFKLFRPTPRRLGYCEPPQLIISNASQEQGFVGFQSSQPSASGSTLLPGNFNSSTRAWLDLNSSPPSSPTQEDSSPSTPQRSPPIPTPKQNAVPAAQAGRQHRQNEVPAAQAGRQYRKRSGTPAAQAGRQRSTTQNAHAGGRCKSSRFKGVSLYDRVNRWEAHIWAKRNKEDPLSKSRQIYIGSCLSEEAAARLYDRAVIYFRDAREVPNFHYDDYVQEIPQWKDLSPAKFVKLLRDMSRGKSELWFNPQTLERVDKRDARWKAKESGYTGVYTFPKESGSRKKWRAQIKVAGKSVRLGCTDIEEVAARAYDIAAIKFYGREEADAKLNFPANFYEEKMPKGWIDSSKPRFLKWLRSKVAKSNNDQLIT